MTAASLSPVRAAHDGSTPARPSPPPWPATGFLRRVGSLITLVDTAPGLLAPIRRLRAWLPGDDRYGDPLSVGAPGLATGLTDRLVTAHGTDASALRDLGLTSLQLCRALIDDDPTAVGGRSITVVFTELSDFPDWAHQLGPLPALGLLRRVSAAIEPVLSHHGRIIKRPAPGALMAVFATPTAALDAATAARDTLDRVTDTGPLRLRAGVHTGNPRPLGGDYFGADVNIAARLLETAHPGEVLITGPTRSKLSTTPRRFHPVRWHANGVPADLAAYRVDQPTPPGTPRPGRAPQLFPTNDQPSLTNVHDVTTSSWTSPHGRATTPSA